MNNRMRHTAVSLYGLYLIDVYYEKYDTNATKEPVVDGIIKYKCSYGLMESNGLGGVYSNDIREMLEERKWYGEAVKYSVSQNKELRIYVNSGTVKEKVVLRNDADISEGYKLFLEDLFSYNKMIKDQDDDGWDMLSMIKKMLMVVSD